MTADRRLMEPLFVPSRSALLFFDVLKGYAYGPDGRTVLPEARGQVAACVRVMEAARERGMPIFYAQADHRPDGGDHARAITDLDLARASPSAATGLGVVSGAVAAEIIDELAPRPDDYVIRKHRWSAFFQTELELSLRARSVDTILLAGGSTEVGIAATAYAARDLDFSTILLRECARSGRGTMVSDYFLDEIFPRLARVRKVDEVIAALHAAPRAR